MFTPQPKYFGSQQMDISRSNILNQIVPKSKYRFKSIIAIGNPIVDISAEVEKESLEKYHLAWGATVFVDEYNIGFYNDLESRPRVTYIPGGSIQNTLRVTSWCLGMQKDLKDQFSITMLGAVGNDSYKEKIINSLKLSGVVPLLQNIPNLETSRCGVAIYKKERCLLPQIRASNQLSMDFITQHADEIDKNDCILIEGYFLQERFELCQKLCQDFSNNDKYIILTFSAVFMVQAHREKIQEIANYANMIVANMDELREFTKSRGDDYKDIFEKAAKSLAQKDRLFVVTNGSKESLVVKFDYNKGTLDYIIQSFPNVMKIEDIVDLNGAGDAFLGGFLSEFMKGSPLEVCSRKGNDVASIILKNVGCTFPKTLDKPI